MVGWRYRLLSGRPAAPIPRRFLPLSGQRPPIGQLIHPSPQKPGLHLAINLGIEGG